LDNGEAVLNSIGFKSKNIYFDLSILFLFSLLAFIFGYIGVFRKIKAQAVY